MVGGEALSLLWSARQRSGTCRQAGGTATFPEGRTCPATLPVPLGKPGE